MNKAIKMTRRELVWETRVGIFDEKKWYATLEWLKTFSIKEPDIHTWEGRWSLVYNRVKDMSFDDVLADYREYDKHTGKHIVFPFNAEDDYGDESDTQVTLHSLVDEWLRDDAHDSELLYQTYAHDSDEYVEFVED